MKHRAVCHAVMVLSLFSCVAMAAAPKVVKAVPDNGAIDVDPGTTELRVTFDQAMDMGGFSFVGGGESFPGSGAQSHWIDETTCVLPIALKPAHSYWLSINSNRFQNFRSKQGEPATPYPISFVTAEAAGTPPLTPELNEAAIAKLRQALQDDYAYLELHKVDWNQEFALAEPALKKAKTAQQFAATAGKILAKADDMHIWLMAGKVLIPAKIRRVDPNCSIPVLMRLVPNCQPKNAMVWTGRYDDGIAYVMIRNFTGDASSLSPALDALQNCSAVIVDVRTNSGGDELLARQFAGCFVTAPQTYAKDIIRRGGKDSPVYERVLDPNPSRPIFGGKVALLIGPENMSSCESFIMMMKTLPNCTTIGQKTYGSSGNPRPHDLGNGVTVMLPSWRDLRLDGTCFEGEGLTPDIQVDGGGGSVDDPVLIVRSPSFTERLRPSQETRRPTAYRFIISDIHHSTTNGYLFAAAGKGWDRAREGR